VVAALSVYSFVSTARDSERRRVCMPLCAMRPNYAAQNRLAPDFDLPSIDGKRRRRSDYAGKVLILNFWTKSCPPCLEEMPSLAELAKILREHPGIELVSICTDDTAEEIRGTLQSVLGGQAPFPVLIDPDAKVVTGKYGTRMYPETWFIDGQGVIRARFDGVRDWASPLTVNFAETLKSANTCEIQFSGASPFGPLAGLCDEIGAAG
jgi:thiol-disulfide isomerase/thioredoxin